MQGNVSLSEDAPVLFVPPQQEYQVKHYPVTAVHVAALPRRDSTMKQNTWLFLLEVKGPQGTETLQLDLIHTSPGSMNCRLWCHNGPKLAANGLVPGMAKADKLAVVRGHTVDTVLGKMEAHGLLHYEFATVEGTFSLVIPTYTFYSYSCYYYSYSHLRKNRETSRLALVD